MFLIILIIFSTMIVEETIYEIFDYITNRQLEKEFEVEKRRYYGE